MAGGLRAAIQARGTVLERNAKKTRFAIVATLFIAFFFSIGVLFFVKYRNAVKINDKLCPEDPHLCSMVGDNLYDVGFLLWGEWTDDDEAYQYLLDIDSYSDEKYAQGSRFTLIYLMGGSFAFSLAVYYFLMLLARFCCHKCLSSVGVLGTSAIQGGNIGVLVATGIYRFNSMGKLAALSTCPAQYDESATFENYYLSDSRTYADESMIVTVLWSSQIVFFAGHCLYIGFFCRRSDGDE